MARKADAPRDLGRTRGRADAAEGGMSWPARPDFLWISLEDTSPRFSSEAITAAV